MSTAKIIIISVIALIVIMVLWDVARGYRLVQKTKVLMQAAVPYSRPLPNASMHILVLGDSTAVGTGASKPEDTTAGRLGTLYPQAEVVNISENGLKLEGLIQKLDMVGENEHFDIVLIQIGANDIIRLTSNSKIQERLDTVLTRAEAFGGKVIVLHSGKIGDSKLFPWYVRPILNAKSLKVRAIYQKETALHHAAYVDLVESSISETLKVNPRMYYASDLLHLSSEGYKLWFEEIVKKI